jgi:hypothetical protein
MPPASPGQEQPHPFVISTCTTGTITATATRIDNPSERVPYTYKAIGVVGAGDVPSVLAYHRACHQTKEDWAALYTQPNIHHCSTTVNYRWDQGFATAHIVQVQLNWKPSMGSIQSRTARSDGAKGDIGEDGKVPNPLTLYELGPAEYWANGTISGGEKAAVLRQLFALDEKPVRIQHEHTEGERNDDDVNQQLSLSSAPTPVIHGSMMDQLERRGIVLLVPEVLDAEVVGDSSAPEEVYGSSWVELVIPHGLVASMVSSEHIVQTEHRPKWMKRL